MMRVYKLQSIKLFLLWNLFCFVNVSSIHLTNADSQELEGSGMHENFISLDDKLNRMSANVQNISSMEEKLKSLSETLKQLELKMESLKNINMDSLQENLHKIVEQIVKEKIDLASKNSFNVHEMKCSDDRLPTSCHDLNECNNNIYTIRVPEFSSEPFPAVCDLKTDDGGWTLIQRRQDGSENFYRNWNEYVQGFGNMNGEFFIGLEKLHVLTSHGNPQELYIILQDFEGERHYARYGEFRVDSNETDYKLTVSNYSGDAGDCFSQHSGKKFSTRDRDNDDEPFKNCASFYNGGWWYSNCFFSHLNGLYLSGRTLKSKKGISWYKFRGYNYSLKFVQMMIRSKLD